LPCFFANQEPGNISCSIRFLSPSQSSRSVHSWALRPPRLPLLSPAHIRTYLTRRPRIAFCALHRTRKPSRRAPEAVRDLGLVIASRQSPQLRLPPVASTSRSRQGASCRILRGLHELSPWCFKNSPIVPSSQQANIRSALQIGASTSASNLLYRLGSSIRYNPPPDPAGPWAIRSHLVSTASQ